MLSTSNHTAPAADAIASIGLDEIYVELHIRPLGAVYELHADLVQYNAYTGRYLRDEISRQIADDADDAIEAAVDLEWEAYKTLNVHDVTGGYKSPCGFGEAVERLFNEGYASHAIAAE